MKEKKPEILRVEFQPDGAGGGVFEGNLLVIGFKWRDSAAAFEPITINREWEELLMTDRSFQDYLSLVITEMIHYREGALKLAAQKKLIEYSLSNKCFIVHKKRSR